MYEGGWVENHPPQLGQGKTVVRKGVEGGALRRNQDQKRVRKCV